jgi:hypothetical protein
MAPVWTGSDAACGRLDLRFSLSYRDVEELLAERGLHADHVTVWRWVQRYAPELERRLRRHLKPTNDSWRVDETYIRVKGKWVYLYRAVDSSDATIDFLLSAKRDAATAQRFLTKAFGRWEPSGTAGHQQRQARRLPTGDCATRVFWRRTAGVDRCSTSIMSSSRITGASNAGCVQANIFVRSGELGVWIAGYEAIHMIRKGQPCCSVGLLHHFILGLFAATN